VANCPGDRIIVWAIVVLALLLFGGTHLIIVSGVGLSRKGSPSGRLKLVIYFAQVRVVSTAAQIVVAAGSSLGVGIPVPSC
jgi:hypothetical protein